MDAEELDSAPSITSLIATESITYLRPMPSIQLASLSRFTQ